MTKNLITDLDLIPLNADNIFQFFNIIKDVFSLLLTKNPKALLTNKSNAPSITYSQELIDYYKTHMKKSGQKHEILLLDTLLITLGYNPEESTFEPVYEEDFLYFTLHLDKLVRDYFEISIEDTPKRESFIIALVINSALNHPRKCEKMSKINLHIAYIKNQLGEELSSQINGVLERFCTSEGYDVEKIFESLANIHGTEDAHAPEDASCSSLSAASVTATLPIRQPINYLQSMLKYFNVMERYPQKFTFRDSLVIRHKISNSEIQPIDLPLFVMDKIMACDRKCRSILIPCRIPKIDYYVYENEESEDSDSSGSEPEDSNNKDGYCIIHPLDIIMILLHCSDNFLHHELFSKLFSCQLAVPLLLPDSIKNSLTMLLWALRSIKKSWKAVDRCGEVHSRNCSIVDYEAAVVSFLKCGKQLFKSKSKLLNDVIGSEDIFFHWDLLKEQSCYKIVSQGVVELCCYYPSKKNSIFKDAVIFTNLRGDAVQYPNIYSEDQFYFMYTH